MSQNLPLCPCVRIVKDILEVNNEQTIITLLIRVHGTCIIEPLPALNSLANYDERIFILGPWWWSSGQHTPMIRVRIPLKSACFFAKLLLKRTKINTKRPGFAYLKTDYLHKSFWYLKYFCKVLNSMSKAWQKSFIV